MLRMYLEYSLVDHEPSYVRTMKLTYIMSIQLNSQLGTHVQKKM